MCDFLDRTCFVSIKNATFLIGQFFFIDTKSDLSRKCVIDKKTMFYQESSEVTPWETALRSPAGGGRYIDGQLPYIDSSYELCKASHCMDVLVTELASCSATRW